MRSWLLCAALAVFLVSNAAAQTGTVCLYADPQGTQCNISDTAPGILSVYVIYSGDPSLTGAIGVAFAAPKPECMVGATWLTDMSPFPAGAVSGNSQTGVWVTYGGCVTPPTHVLTIQYMTSGLSQTDCAYGVVADPWYGAITVATCDAEEVQAAGGVSYVNSVLPCVCSGSSGLPLLYVTPTSMSFGQADTSRELTISNGGGGVLTWSIAESAPWLSTNPASGTGVARIDVQVDRTGLPLGAYSTDLIVTSNGGTVPVHVSMEVVQSLVVSPQSLTFEMNTTELILHVESTGPEPIPWTVDCNRSWLTASPTQWVDDGDVRVRVNRSGLAVGTYTGVVTVTGAGQTISVPVTMKVGSSQGPGGTIGVFSDPQALSCNLFDSTPGLLTVYIVHLAAAGGMASQFAAPVTPCMTGVTYLGETSTYAVTVGNTQTGVSIGYGACYSGTIHVLTVRFFGTGLSEPCCVYPVVPDWYHGQTEIKMVDCTQHEVVGGGAYAIVNPNSSCQCGSIKTEEATWGKIKSMYSDE